jgi:PKD repeat protein
MTVDFYGTPTFGGSTLTVQFTNTTDFVPSSWYWNFGDGNFSDERSPSHTYHLSGGFANGFTVTLYASASNGIAYNKVRSNYIILTK